MSAFEFIRSEKAKSDDSVSAMCRVLGVSRSGFYAWSTRLPSARARRNATLESQIRSVYIESGKCYGSIKVTRALRRVGEVVSVKNGCKGDKQKWPRRSKKATIQGHGR